VVVAGRRDEAGKALVKELPSFGSEAEFIKADVREEHDVRALVDKAVARFGRIDVAVNNAATEGAVGPITNQTAESYAATFDTNVLGVILSMKHEVRVMKGQRSGSIISISSTYGQQGAAGAPIYVGAKHAVEGITKSVATLAPSSRPAVSTATAQWRSSSPAMQTSSRSVATSRRTPIYRTA
jgi:NAD(P)-dependent dehydrogenase (short-subunit alcohol dehydrogenase family)